MLSKKTISLTATVLGDMRFKSHCERLAKDVEGAMVKAFEGERISICRRDRIINKFLKELEEK